VRTSIHARTLYLALEVAGSPRALAEAIRVTTEEMRRWLDGDARIPAPVFLALVDIIATRTLPIRAAHLPEADAS
jgi:hypothetical protein